MNYYILILLAFFSLQSNGQNTYKITYLKSSNGKLIENQDPTIVYSNDFLTRVISKSIDENKIVYPSEYFNLNRKSNTFIQIAALNSEKLIATNDSTSLAKQSFELLNETKKILGYNCKKAKTIINSNTIELWYTNDLKIKGAPTQLGQNLGLVLEMVRNGNFVIAATKVEKLKKIPEFPNKDTFINSFDLLTYRDLLWKSRFTTLSVFKDEIINFSDASKSNDSILRYANGTVILRKIKIPAIAK